MLQTIVLLGKNVAALVARTLLPRMDMNHEHSDRRTRQPQLIKSAVLLAVSCGPFFSATSAGDDIFFRRIDANNQSVISGSFRRIAEPSTSRNALDSALAYNIRDQEYMAVWSFADADKRGRSIVAQRISATGGLIGSNRNLSGDHIETDPAIAYNGIDNEYLLSYTFQRVNVDAPFPTGSAVGKRLTARGELIQADFLISDAEYNTSLVHNPSNNEYYHTSRGLGIFGQRIGADGTLLSPRRRLDSGGASGPNGQLALNSLDSEYLAIWRVQSPYLAIGGRFVAESGAPIGRQFLIEAPPVVDVGWRGIENVFDPIHENFFVVYYGQGLDQRIGGQLIDTDGVLIGTPLLLNEEHSGNGFSVAYGESLEKYLLVATTHDGLFGQFIGPTGDLLNESFIIAQGNVREPDVVFHAAAQEFGVVWSVPEPSNVALLAVGLLGLVVRLWHSRAAC